MSWHERFEEDPSNRWLRSVIAQVTVALNGENDGCIARAGGGCPLCGVGGSV